LPDDWSSRTRIHPHHGHPQGKWLNYVRSPFLRVAWELPGISLRGVDMTFGPSSLPLRTGMSSSSAIIVLAFLALYLANQDQLPEWSDGEVCSLLGEAEWYIGTRGGANDQTTILRNEPNGLLYNRHSKTPIECTPLPPLHGVRVVIANSLWEVSPYLGATDIINLRKGWMMLANELLLACRNRWPSASAPYAHLGSLVEDLLGVTDDAIEEMIALLPEEITLAEAGSILGRDLARDYPEGVYHPRAAADFFHKQNLIGRSIERILNEADGRLKSGDLSIDSHEYDEYRRQIGLLMDGIQTALRDDFGVSNSQLDGMLEIARQGPGFLGAKLMGAGVGGYAAFLVRAEDEEAFCWYLDRHYYGKPALFDEYRQTLDRLERSSKEGSPQWRAALEMKMNLGAALKYPSE
jgi:galactokinase